eukprot:Amastigsp_a678908_3.p2 type:complete len:160 gc:universal Amastigsp_a678908_3:864-385(-)
MRTEIPSSRSFAMRLKASEICRTRTSRAKGATGAVATYNVSATSPFVRAARSCRNTSTSVSRTRTTALPLNARARATTTGAGSTSTRTTSLDTGSVALASLRSEGATSAVSLRNIRRSRIAQVSAASTTWSTMFIMFSMAMEDGASTTTWLRCPLAATP